MKTGGWYISLLVITFIYFYIYAVNYVRGAVLPDQADGSKFSQDFFKQETMKMYREARQGGRQVQGGLQQPIFPRLSMQYHNYTR